ncbi:MAG: hypothetical protein ACK5NY_00570 [Burkholderiaceae bacterium]|jgi:hypothetical protein
MNSIADRLTRAYGLFHWLHMKPVANEVRGSFSYTALEQELLSLQIQPKDFSAVAADTTDSFEESRLAFMVRYCGLTWSTCSLFCDAIEHEDWLRNGTPFLVTFDPNHQAEMHGLKKVNLNDFQFLKPEKVVMVDGYVKSFVIRWTHHESRRIERFLRLAAARHGIDIRVDSIAQSEQFLKAIQATMGASAKE